MIIKFKDGMVISITPTELAELDDLGLLYLNSDEVADYLISPKEDTPDDQNYFFAKFDMKKRRHSDLDDE